MTLPGNLAGQAIPGCGSPPCWRESAYAALSWSAGNLAGTAVRPRECDLA